MFYIGVCCNFLEFFGADQDCSKFFKSKMAGIFKSKKPGFWCIYCVGMLPPTNRPLPTMKRPDPDPTRPDWHKKRGDPKVARSLVKEVKLTITIFQKFTAPTTFSLVFIIVYT